MSENVFAKFNEMFDLSGLKTDIESAASNSGGDFVVATRSRLSSWKVLYPRRARCLC